MMYQTFFVALVGLAAIPYSLRAAEHKTDAAEFGEAVTQFVETGRAKPLVGLRKLRWAAGLDLNGKFEDPLWLKPTITVPLRAVGISMTEQAGEDSDSTLPLLLVEVEISGSASTRYEVSVFTTLSRAVLLADIPTVGFHADVWRKDNSRTQSTLSDARASAKLMLDQHMSELVKYWAMANPPSAHQQ